MANAVLITGTSTGIGRASVERMAAAGWTVYAGVRKEADAADVAAVGDAVFPVILDVTNRDHIAAVTQRLAEELGERGLDGLVNNAGVGQGGSIETTSETAWRWHFDVNVFGVVNLTRECVPLLRAARGRVVNIGSKVGRSSAPMMAAYSAGKHAVEAISESLRFEVEDFGMRVACIAPGEVKTAIWEKAGERLSQVVASLDADAITRYDRHFDMLYGFVAGGSERGIPAARVADAVHHALTSPRPKHRYLVGRDARQVGLISRLPDGLRHRALARKTASWARAGRKIRSS